MKELQSYRNFLDAQAAGADAITLRHLARVYNREAKQQRLETARLNNQKLGHG